MEEMEEESEDEKVESSRHSLPGFLIKELRCIKEGNYSPIFRLLRSITKQHLRPTGHFT